jgi:SPX domain protein involved in polyphosphate accumulation
LENLRQEARQLEASSDSALNSCAVDEAERRREIDSRVRELNERLDRLFAFRIRSGRSLEERVQDLERQVLVLWRLVVQVNIAASDDSLRTLEKMERILDEAERQETPPPPNGS